jgi:hypothetical protein
VELSLAGGKGRHTYRPTANTDDLGIKSMLLEDPGVFSHKKNPAPFVQTPKVITILDGADAAKSETGKRSARKMKAVPAALNKRFLI